MLKEYLHVKQEPGCGLRRWFSDGDLELIVWYDKNKKLSGFQLCYHLRNRAIAFTWKGYNQFSHRYIDAGSVPPFKNNTPILTGKCEDSIDFLVDLFEERSANIESVLRKTVLDILQKVQY